MRRPSLLRRSLAARLAAVFGLVSLLVVVAMGLSVYILTARYLEAKVRDDLAALADFYAVFAASAAPDEERLAALAPQIASFFAPQAGYEVRLFGARNGLLLATTRDIGPLPSSAALAQLERRPALFLAASQDQPGRFYVARPITAADGSLLAVVEISRDLTETQAFLGALRLVLLGAGGGALIAAVLASFLLARQLARPLRDMASATRAIAGGDLDRRVPVTSADEVGRLAASINRMAADLARLEAARREFIAKISHDLRTPLTAIKGFVINLQDIAPGSMQPALVTIDEQTDRLVRLVNDLLILSRLQRGELRLQRAPIDLAQVVRSTSALTEPKAQRLGLGLHLDLPPGLPLVNGDADRLQQAVLNLLDNALRVTPAGGLVQISLVPAHGEVILRVLDQGPGLSADDEAQVFEPYYRGIGGGAGLGLSIAREIVIAHGGRIWLRSRPEGGAEAGLSLPISPS